MLCKRGQGKVAASKAANVCTRQNRPAVHDLQRSILRAEELPYLAAEARAKGGADYCTTRQASSTRSPTGNFDVANGNTAVHTYTYSQNREYEPLARQW